MKFVDPNEGAVRKILSDLLRMLIRFLFLLANALFLIFIVLKLTDNIKWSWGWVLSPYWIFGMVLFLDFIGFIIIHSIDERKKHKSVKPVMMDGATTTPEFPKGEVRRSKIDP